MISCCACIKKTRHTHYLQDTPISTTRHAYFVSSRDLAAIIIFIREAVTLESSIEMSKRPPPPKPVPRKPGMISQCMGGNNYVPP